MKKSTIVKFSQYTHFTMSEIDQIITLVQHASYARWIDRRCFTKNVIAWGLNWGLLYKGEEQRWPGDQDGKIYVASNFDALNLPIFVLWKLVDKIIGERTGYSIARQQAWQDLNIYEAGNKFQTEQDANAMFRVMGKLQQHHFIIFQCGGEIWQITRLPESDWWINDCF